VTPKGGQPASVKLQRWIDLLAALLTRKYPATLDQLFREVPAYAAAGLDPKTKAYQSARRKFERDKDELRGYGIPIETRTTHDDEIEGYVLDRREFYLPYLSLHQRAGTTTPKRPAQFGYAALRSLTLDADELAAVADAARRVRSLGDPDLADAATSAMRKLAFDLPVDAANTSDDPEIVPQPTGAERATFTRLADALDRRKRVTFGYRSPRGDSITDREVEPYGLFFLGHQWYAAAREPSSGVVKNFRISRISRVTVNDQRAQTPDYTVPAKFELREHARSRQAWELGDAGATDVVVRVRSATGAAAAAAQLGEPVSEQPDRRRFQVRRPDAFARWLLSFGGELEPVEPPEAVENFRRLVSETLALYGR
jgi:proteasome accessory factor B